MSDDNDRKMFTVAAICIAVVLVALITSIGRHAGLSQREETSRANALFSNCKQLDVHRNEYGGVTSYECGDKPEAK